MACTFAFDTPPLVQPELVFAQGLFTVKLFLDEPLLFKPDYSQLVALCAVADTLIERVQKVPKASFSFDVSILSTIEGLCKQIAPKKDAQETLTDLGLFDTFPYLRQGLSGDKLENATTNLGAAYFAYVSLMNQVVMMGTQLYHDACIPQHHKYAAHQVALLYQCLNQLQGDTKPIRKLIETRFDEIKNVTESAQPELPIELSDWVQEITWTCREEVRNCPPYIHKRLEPVLRTIRQRG